MATTVAAGSTGFSRLKLFLALSRTPHGVLDMASPALSALLWLGGFPPLHVTLLGLVTVFAGYTAVYALNDVIDYRVDKEKFRLGGVPDVGNDLDALMVRHPMAQGLLSYREAVFWAAAWAVVAMVGAWLLNPVCVWIFIAGCVLEFVYCRLLQISHLRSLVNGMVKTAGSIAAVFAVDPSPSPIFVVALFAWLFVWEIGGQNVPNDWVDMEEDRRVNACTIPVRFGPLFSGGVILSSLILTLGLSVFLLSRGAGGLVLLSAVLALMVGVYLLLLPALQLVKSGVPADAMALFNKASHYPVAMLGVVLVHIGWVRCLSDAF